MVVSAISFWEAAMLAGKRRLQLDLSLTAMRRAVIEQGIREIVISGAIGIAAAQLPDFHGDPADRLIVATALSLDATLLTADESILGRTGPLHSRDARR
ncbi:MAG: type II toxin-antitoxin system VapC family toxin [Deltaproteobacteria bacterium]|nr:type II toxin-antitoxin system VapC family toxin [Deltaproteobacteria bacterium]